MGDIRCILELRSLLGEGPVWHAEERRLYWVDLERPALYRFDPATGANEALPVALGSHVGGLVLRAGGGLIIETEAGLFAVDRASGRLDPLVNPEAGRSDIWFNDAKCDRRGWLWAGTADRREAAPLGCLYRIAPDLAWERLDSGFICANGPAFSPDGRIAYFADSYAREIYRYDIDAVTGAVGPRRLFARVDAEDGYPDGMTVDAEGFLWNAHWDGWRVTRYAPDGRVDRMLRLPVPRVTSVGFGGHDLTTLYITTASTGLSAAELDAAPLSGALFACRPGVRGLPEPRFAG